MYKQIGHLLITASTIDNICFVDTESTSTLGIIAGGLPQPWCLLVCTIAAILVKWFTCLQNNMLSYMNLYLTSVSSVCGLVIWLHLTLVLVLTPAPSTLPFGSNVQNNRWWISYWSVETLRPKTISVGAALVCRLWLWWFALGFDSSMKFAPTYHAEIR